MSTTINLVNLFISKILYFYSYFQKLIIIQLLYLEALALEESPCYWGLYKNGLCWIWASGDNKNAKDPFGEWRSPTEDEWLERPSWQELADHCHSDTFGGGPCDIEYAKTKGNVGFCRAKGSSDCGSEWADLMYVKTSGE